MSSELERRTAIIVALRCGRTPKEIVEFFHFPKSTVYDIAKTFKESGEAGGESLTPQRKTQDRSEVRKRNKDFLEQLQVLIDEDRDEGGLPRCHEEYCEAMDCSGSCREAMALPTGRSSCSCVQFGPGLV